MPLFSERYGYAQPQLQLIEYRNDLPEKLRLPIIDILWGGVSHLLLRTRVNWLFNRYGLDEWAEPLAGNTLKSVLVSKQDSQPDIAAKRILLTCAWFRVYDFLEDIFNQLHSQDTDVIFGGLEEPRAGRFQEKLNEYFEYVGIGWKMIGGEIIVRGDTAYERTVSTAEVELEAAGRVTAAERIKNAIRSLSVRPDPDVSGAITHATAAMECVLHDVTGTSMTLGDYIKRNPDLFPGAMKTAFAALWGYTSNEGGRHGKEGVKPPLEDAEFVVSIAAALTTYLNRKHPRTSKLGCRV